MGRMKDIAIDQMDREMDPHFVHTSNYFPTTKEGYLWDYDVKGHTLPNLTRLQENRSTTFRSDRVLNKLNAINKLTRILKGIPF